MSEHYEERCKHGTLMGQCRCPSQDKAQRLIACNDKCPKDYHDSSTTCPECNTHHPNGWACPKQLHALQTQLEKAQRDDSKDHQCIIDLETQLATERDRVKEFYDANENLIFANTSLRRDKDFLQAELAKYKLERTSDVPKEKRDE